MIEILLGAKGTGKTRFLQKANAATIQNTALYATAGSLVNDWSKQHVLLASLIPADGMDLIWGNNLIFELDDKPFKIASMEKQFMKYADTCTIYVSMEKYAPELHWLFEAADIIHYFHLEESQLTVIPQKYFPNKESRMEVSKLAKYKYLTYFCGGAL